MTIEIQIRQKTNDDDKKMLILLKRKNYENLKKQALKTNKSISLVINEILGDYYERI